LVPVNTTITASAQFTDVGTGDTHAGTYNWDDGTTSSATVAETNGSGSVSGTHKYTAAGVYLVALTLNDDDGGTASAEYQYVVVYDPNAGFVTGGGWMMSEAGACRLTSACGAASGKANFGFVAKYKKGANVPEGDTEFQFHAGNLNFKSKVYEWLVVSGARAQFKGTGTINGAGDYGFLLTSTDGSLPGGGGSDKFRIKIVDKATGAVVYDNQATSSDDDLTAGTAISGGSIVIHSK
jgi:PKD repeat protein